MKRFRAHPFSRCWPLLLWTFLVFFFACPGVASLSHPHARHATSYERDAQGDLLRMIDPLGNALQFAYNGQGNVIRQTDALGTVTENQYNSSGNLTNVTIRSSSLEILSSIAYTYDASGNRQTETKLRTINGVPEYLTTQFIYDHENRLTHTIHADGSTNQTVYNAFGKESVGIDALGRQTRFDYDDSGRLVRTVYPDGTSEGVAYDAEGHKVAVTNQLGQVTWSLYDALGRQTITIYPDGARTTNYYNLIGQLMAATDARTNTTWYGYDAAGRRTSLTNALNQVTGFGYDAAGNQVWMQDALGRCYTNMFDGLNRRVAVWYPDGSFSYTIYDALGRRIAETDQATNTTWFGYDASGRLTSVTNALGYVTRYEYNELGQQTAQIDANNHRTAFEYDVMGRRTKRILPLGQFETYQYDWAGNLTNRVDFNGQSLALTYDNQNRLVGRLPSVGAPVSFAYDALGQRTNMVDASGATAYRYNDRGRLVEKAVLLGGTGMLPFLNFTLSYAYDPVGNLTNIISTTPNGTAIIYGYDPLNRLNAVSDAHTGRTGYNYDGVGNLYNYTHPNGISSTYHYDSLNRLTNLVTYNLGLETIANYAYTVGPSGNRTSATETLIRDPLNPVPRTINRIYTYDSLYRLTGEQITVGTSSTSSLTYEYDAVGNRLYLQSTLPEISPRTYGYDPNDGLLSDTYDANGNTLTAQGFGQSAPDEYDADNRLITRRSPQSTVRLWYDGDGNRVAKTVTTVTNSITTFYVVDDQNPTGYAQVLEEHQSLDGQPLALTATYCYGHALLSQTRHSPLANTHYYGCDGHGNVCYLTDALGQITDTYDYDAFGNLIARTGETPNNYLFTSEQYDSDLGLYFLRARYHNPITGRFWTMDSFEGNNGDPYSLHKYLYCLDNPINRIDPSGKMTITEALEAARQSVELELMAAPAIRGTVMLAIRAWAVVGSAAAANWRYIATKCSLGLQAVSAGPSIRWWGVSRDGINQGIKHFHIYWTDPAFQDKIGAHFVRTAQLLGQAADYFKYSPSGFQRYTEEALNIATDPRTSSRTLAQGRTLFFWTKDGVNGIIVWPEFHVKSTHYVLNKLLNTIFRRF